MDFRNSFGLISSPIFSILEDFSDEPKAEKSRNENHNQPSRAYVRDAKAMAATPADVIEYPNAYAITMDMPGIKADEIKVTVENGNVLVVSGERKRDIDAPEGTENGDHNHGYEKRSDGGVKYLRMERRMGKFMRKFRLPENADMEAVAANCRDGVLTVRLEKLPPPELKRPKTIQVKDA